MKMTAPMELGICVAELGRSMAFYEGLLGMRKISEIPLNEHGARTAGLGTNGYTVVRLQTDYGERIKLVQPMAAPALRAEAETPSSRVGFAYLTFLVADIAAIVDQCQAAGFPSARGVVELRPGVRMALVRDPDGNVIEFAQYDDIRTYRPDLK